MARRDATIRVPMTDETHEALKQIQDEFGMTRKGVASKLIMWLGAQSPSKRGAIWQWNAVRRREELQASAASAAR